MTLNDAKQIAQKGIKVTHDYFTKDEYMTMSGNMIIFEDGVKVFFDEWVKDKSYLLIGWSIYGDSKTYEDELIQNLCDRDNE